MREFFDPVFSFIVKISSVLVLVLITVSERFGSRLD